MYKQLVDSNDKAVERGLSRQVLDPNSRYYGGTIDPYTGIAWVNHTTGTPTDMCYWGQRLLTPIQAIIGMKSCYIAFYWQRSLCSVTSMKTAPYLRDGPTIIRRQTRHLSWWGMLSCTSCFNSRIGRNCSLCWTICGYFGTNRTCHAYRRLPYAEPSLGVMRGSWFPASAV